MNGASKWRLSLFSSLHGFPLHPRHQDLPGERSTLRAVQARPDFGPQLRISPSSPPYSALGPSLWTRSHLPFPSLSDYKQQPGPGTGSASGRREGCCPGAGRHKVGVSSPLERAGDVGTGCLA